ncbi:TPA: hypothetical protein ACF328_000701 [Clostridium perfringens]
MRSFENNYSNWMKLDKESQLNSIRIILGYWDSIGRKISVDDKWFYDSLVSAYYDGEKNTINQEMQLLGTMANVIVDEDRNIKIKKLISELTDNEIEFYLMCEGKIYETHNKNDVISDEDFDNAINFVATKTDKTYDEIFNIWNKVDRAIHGVEI